MKVILKRGVEGLGNIGDVKTVKDGYARNFLLPKGLVLEANDTNLKIIEKEKIKVEGIQKKETEKAQEFAVKLSAASITIPVESNEESKIFGSVGAADISAALKTEGFDIDKKSILLDSPLKELGAVDVLIKVHPSINAKIKVWLVKKEN